MSLSNAQYESIIKGYERTRDFNRHLMSERQSEVYRLLPEYQELDASVSSISVSHAKMMLSGDEGALNSLRTSLAAISSRKKALLASAGLPEDYLEPIYTCSSCHDTGYLVNSEGVKEKCHCFHQQEIALLYEQSNIQEMVSRENFSTLSYEYYQGEDLTRFEKCVEICRKFVQNFKQDYHNLFFYGTVGTGKSFLSGCIAKELLQSGHSVIYFSSLGLFDTLARYSLMPNPKRVFTIFIKTSTIVTW